MTQTPVYDTSLSCADQRHKALDSLSGHFNGASLHWSTIEKEVYAIMATTERIHWLRACDRRFHLHTDHNNLVFLLDPTCVVAEPPQTTLREVPRWAFHLSAYSYTCIHFPGADNVWADLLNSWTAPPLLRQPVSIPFWPSSSSYNFFWPSSDAIATSQCSHASSRPKDLHLCDDGLYCDRTGAIWGPDKYSYLQLQLCIIAHTGPSGHHAASSTAAILKTCFVWSTLSTYIDTLVGSCIHCLSTVGGEKIPRPFCPAVHRTTGNNLLQFY